MEQIPQLQIEPHYFLRNFFGEKYVVLSIMPDGQTQYCVGALNSVELAYLVKILDIISQDKITGDE
jgi:hypothetical protein